MDDPDGALLVRQFQRKREAVRRVGVKGADLQEIAEDLRRLFGDEANATGHLGHDVGDHRGEVVVERDDLAAAGQDGGRQAQGRQDIDGALRPLEFQP